jgi:hypothetical protein
MHACTTSKLCHAQLWVVLSQTRLQLTAADVAVKHGVRPGAAALVACKQIGWQCRTIFN